MDQIQGDDANLANLGLPSQEVTKGNTNGKYKVLILGDGDMSYSLALSRSLLKLGLVEQVKIVATTFDSEQVMRERYSRFGSISQALGDGVIGEHVVLCHGIDARRLEEYPEICEHGKFDRIIFNFPHHGGMANLQLHREFTAAMMQGIRKALDLNGEAWITLVGGQGGTLLDSIRRIPKDTWQIQDKAAEAGLLLTRVFPSVDGFRRLDEVSREFNDGLEYRRTGKKNLDRTFYPNDAVTHVFQFPRPGLRRAACAMEWVYDLAFYIDPVSFKLQDFETITRNIFGEHVEVKYHVLDEYQMPNSPVQCRTLHVKYSSDVIPLSKASSHDLMYESHRVLCSIAALSIEDRASAIFCRDST